jgi:hypothetical protein
MSNLLPFLSKLDEKDLENIAIALRRKGHLKHLLHFRHAAKAINEIAFSDLEDVITALREAAPTYPDCLHTIRKLQRKGRRPIP